MLQLTKRSEYALIALVHMVDREGEVTSVRELCERYPLPKRLVAEVLKDLSHAGLVISQRGAQGGYSLAQAAESITLGQIVGAIEGAPALTNCDSIASTRDGGCEVHPVCPIRSPVERVREHLWRLFEATTLRSLVPAPHANREAVIQRLRESLAGSPSA
ncbi:MAG: Rrf2 family transcriptional regulator [Planctomycetes bacterium]|jgi:Rrf2 family nitric oxide-sensitive transcriptional repressor|nr:Rrf2 family transcriptional regulator [Planctomycetota bacterium]